MPTEQRLETIASRKDLSMNSGVRKEQKRVETLVKLARSRSLVMLGKANGHKKGGVISTKRIWEAIHRVSDIRPVANEAEHKLRVINHENTPWCPERSSFKPRLGIVKD